MLTPGLDSRLTHKGPTLRFGGVKSLLSQALQALAQAKVPARVLRRKVSETGPGQAPSTS